MSTVPTEDAERLGSQFEELTRAPDLEEQVERLLSRLRIAVIFGGDKRVPGSTIYRSYESRSWKSYEEVACDVADALNGIGFVDVELFPDDMRVLDRLRRSKSHIAWLNTGGVQGANPAAHAASILEMAGVPYIGQGPLAASLLDSKDSFKSKAMAAGIATEAFSVWDMKRGVFRPEINSRFQRAFGDYRGPFIAKPVSGRASLNVHFVPDVAGLPGAVKAIHDVTQSLVLIEKYLPGREYCVAVCGPVIARGGRLFRNRGPFSFGAIERVLDHGEKIFTSMDRRPITAQRFRVLDRMREGSLVRELHRIAAEIFLEFNLSSITRIDVRESGDGRLSVLEANPKPDLKRPAGERVSLISAGLPDCGMTYEDLILSLFSDRLDTLLRHQPGSIGHITKLLERRRAPAASSAAGIENAASIEADRTPAADVLMAEVTEGVADMNVRALETVIRSKLQGSGTADSTGDSDPPKKPRGEVSSNTVSKT